MKTKKLATIDGLFLLSLSTYLEDAPRTAKRLKQIARHYEVLSNAAGLILAEYEELLNSGDAGVFDHQAFSKKPEVKIIKNIKRRLE